MPFYPSARFRFAALAAGLAMMQAAHAQALPPPVEALHKQAVSMAAYEGSHVAAISEALADGKPRPLGDEELKPLAGIPPDAAKQLEANGALMTRLGIQATPGIVWRDAAGAVQSRTGAPEPEVLLGILGPR